MVRIIGLALIYTCVLFVIILIGWNIASQITWYALDPLYHFLLFIQDGLVVILPILLIIGYLVIVFFELRKPYAYLEDVVKGVRDINNRQLHMIHLEHDELRDVNDLLNQTKADIELNEQAAKMAEQKKNDLIVYLAHDLKTPLTELKYQEEFMLYSLLIAQSKSPDKIEQIKNFVPYINSWAVCDVFCSSIKDAKKQQQLYWEAFRPFTQSHKEYEIRFFYVMALSYFINEAYLQKIFSLVRAQKYVGFYDKMAVAWLLSMMYVKYPNETETFLQNTPLDKFVFQKSISKICDSFQVKKEAKIHLRTLASKK